MQIKKSNNMKEKESRGRRPAPYKTTTIAFRVRTELRDKLFAEFKKIIRNETEKLDKSKTV